MKYPVNLSEAELNTKAKLIRRQIVEMVTVSGSGHVGGSLSAVEIMLTLFLRQMKHDSGQPAWSDRDRFVLSKGHATPVLYSVLAECGYLPVSLLNTFRQMGSPLQGHPDKRVMPFLETCSGSLGQGLSVAIGHALSASLAKSPSRSYVVMSDGECDEGQTWEAAMYAGFHGKKLGHLMAIIDHNKFQLDDAVKVIMDLHPFADKWRAFNWHVQEVNGHDFTALHSVVEKAHAETERPSVIIADTVKGKGVSFMEHDNKFHGVAPTKDECALALAELQ